MGVGHPYLLVVAVVISLPFLPVLARMFFENRDQFVEDIGLTTQEGRWSLLKDLLVLNYRFGIFTTRGIFLNVLWVFLVWAALITGAYHLLVFVAPYVT